MAPAQKPRILHGNEGTRGLTLIDGLVGLGIIAAFAISVMQLSSIRFHSGVKFHQNRSFNRLVSMIRLLINNESTCVRTFSSVLFDQNPPSGNTMSEIRISSQPWVRTQQAFGDEGNRIWIQSLTFTRPPSPISGGFGTLPPHDGYLVGCTDPVSGSNTISNCHAYAANLRLVVYTNVNSAVADVSQLDPVKEQRVLSEDFPLAVVTDSNSKRIFGCGPRFPAGTTEIMCVQFGRELFNRNTHTCHND